MTCQADNNRLQRTIEASVVVHLVGGQSPSGIKSHRQGRVRCRTVYRHSQRQRSSRLSRHFSASRSPAKSISVLPDDKAGVAIQQSRKSYKNPLRVIVRKLIAAAGLRHESQYAETSLGWVSPTPRPPVISEDNAS